MTVTGTAQRSMTMALELQEMVWHLYLEMVENFQVFKVVQSLETLQLLSHCMQIPSTPKVVKQVRKWIRKLEASRSRLPVVGVGMHPESSGTLMKHCGALEFGCPVHRIHGKSRCCAAAVSTKMLCHAIHLGQDGVQFPAKIFCNPSIRPANYNFNSTPDALQLHL